MLYVNRQTLTSYMEKPWAHLKWAQQNRHLSNPGANKLPEYDPEPMEVDPYDED